MNLGFRVTGKFVRELLDVLDEVVEEIRKEEKEKLPICGMGEEERNCQRKA